MTVFIIYHFNWIYIIKIFINRLIIHSTFSDVFIIIWYNNSKYMTIKVFHFVRKFFVKPNRTLSLPWLLSSYEFELRLDFEKTQGPLISQNLYTLTTCHQCHLFSNVKIVQLSGLSRIQQLYMITVKDRFNQAMVTKLLNSFKKKILKTPNNSTHGAFSLNFP